MISTQTLNQLNAVQDAIHATGLRLDDNDYRKQYHTDLSPLGWHIGHCAFIESYWLREIVLGDNRITRPLHYLYFPENIPKPERGPALPPQAEHLEWCKTLNAENRELLREPSQRMRDNPLCADEYLVRFILQHHAQHLETIQMVLQQRALQSARTLQAIDTPLRASREYAKPVVLSAGNYQVGSTNNSYAFDNEVPAHTVALQTIALAALPVSNAQWLAFIEDDGYHSPRWWSKDGWQWRSECQAEAPEHWRRDDNTGWFAVTHEGPQRLGANDPVYGINYHEAQAFVSWLAATLLPGARLPHEYEWEAACNLGLLDDTGEVWEWCENTFHPYQGFSAFPYDNYSKPWFDGKHYTLRGGSRYTCDVIKRASFRNFYNPDKRHIFAGLRIALPA
ncbi:MAG: SUMF1/EgtB/PvdO family nonheme iron enzyme [Granulosicoccaceae bacterium]|jgi:iron(II)-dependent oxidoreductase